MEVFFLHIQEHAWHQFEQTGSIKDYLAYKSIAEQTRLSAVKAPERKENTDGHCRSGGNHHP